MYFITYIIIIVAIFYTKYMDYKAKIRDLKEYNLQYEVYLNKKIYGNEITTLINRAVDNNEKNKVQKNEKGLYIENNQNSIKIQVKIIDLEKEKVYDMESFYNGGMENFAYLYNEILFECVKIEYNSVGRVNYMLFVQQTI